MFGLPIPNVLGAVNPAATAQADFATSLRNGWKVGWMPLFILAGGLPFPPFSYLGLGGVNLLAVGSTTMFAMKAGFQFFITIINAFIDAYFPKLKWISWVLTTFNPWYVFDLLPMFSPAFAYEGFKMPLTKFNPAKPLHTTAYDDGEGGLTYAMGLITPMVIVVAAGLTCVGSYSLLNILPPSLAASWRPLMNTAFAIIGGLTAVVGGGIGGMMAMPGLLSSLKTGASQVSAVATAAPASTAAPAQRGGGVKSLDTVANDILNKLNNQTGGGSDDVSTNMFLGTLALITAGGIGLALVRSKQDSLRNI